MEKLSVAIIAFNEEKNIRSCLESVSWADEIVLVDSESTDRTVAIAREYTEKVYLQKFLGHKEQKNCALGKAANEWVLSLDADEVVPDELRRGIIDILRDPKADGYIFPRKNFFCGTWLRFGGWYPDWQLRLFRRSKGAFGGTNPHDRVHVKGTVRKIYLPIVHHTYSSMADYAGKQNSYTSITARMYAERKKRSILRTGWFPIFAVVLFLRFVMKFFELYVYKLGILDGYYGFVVSFLRAAFTGLKEIKIREILMLQREGRTGT